MADDIPGWFWLMTLLAFPVGFCWAWIRARRRLQRQMQTQIEAELKRRIEAQLMEHLRTGTAPKKSP